MACVQNDPPPTDASAHSLSDRIRAKQAALAVLKDQLQSAHSRVADERAAQSSGSFFGSLSGPSATHQAALAEHGSINKVGLNGTARRNGAARVRTVFVSLRQI